MKRFLVVIPKPDGGVEVHAMKQWLRQHPDQVPSGLDATTSTSHQLRGALKRSGWSIDENESEVRLVPPGAGVVDANVGPAW
jgi:endonuclease